MIFALSRGCCPIAKIAPGRRIRTSKEVLGTRWRRRFRINPVVEHFWKRQILNVLSRRIRQKESVQRDKQTLPADTAVAHKSKFKIREARKQVEIHFDHFKTFLNFHNKKNIKMRQALINKS